MELFIGLEISTQFERTLAYGFVPHLAREGNTQLSYRLNDVGKDKYSTWSQHAQNVLEQALFLHFVQMVDSKRGYHCMYRPGKLTPVTASQVEEPCFKALTVVS